MYTILLSLLIGTSCAVSDFDVQQYGVNLSNARIFYANSGQIYQKVYDPDEGTWSEGEYLFQGDNITVINPFDALLRAYAANAGQITEYIFDGNDWNPGDLEVTGIRASARYYFSNGYLHIKLYALQDDGSVYLHTYNEVDADDTGEGWTLGTNPVAEIP
jgi:hypothetical protein